MKKPFIAIVLSIAMTIAACVPVSASELPAAGATKSETADSSGDETDISVTVTDISESNEAAAAVEPETVDEEASSDDAGAGTAAGDKETAAAETDISGEEPVEQTDDENTDGQTAEEAVTSEVAAVEAGANAGEDETENEAASAAVTDAGAADAAAEEAETEESGAASASASTGSTEAPAVDEDDTGEIIEETPEEQTCLPEWEETSDELFAAYVDDAFGISNELVDLISGKKITAGSRLSGVNSVIYLYISGQLPLIASGERTSTVFEIPVEDLGLDQLYWTAEELGVDAVTVTTTDEDGNTKTSLASDAKAAVLQIAGFSLSRVTDALLADHPFLLYWYEKTQKTRGVYYTLTARTVDGEKQIGIKGNITFYLPVAEEYTAGDYLVDTSVGQKVQTAAANAADIVSKYSGGEDLEVLTAYKTEVCGLTNYNKDAAAGNYSYSYGDPWQLIWVFDGDTETEVVCEGYSKAFKYLCDQTDFDADIDCRIVTGDMNGMGHMWNIVNMDDDMNYLADVTNCDAGHAGADDKLFLVGTAGSAEEGYTITLSSGLSITYIYDDEMFDVWGTENLTLNDHSYCIHEWEDTYTTDREPTCTEKGSESIHCSKCGDSKAGTSRDIAVLDHSWEEGYTVDRESTCAVAGSESIHCSKCGESKNGSARDLPLKDHTWDTEYTVDKEATSTETGSESIHCTVCGEIQEGSSRTVAKLTKPVSELTITGIVARTYNKKAQTQAVVVKDGDVTLTEGTHYTVDYGNNINAGTATVTITGMDNYTGSVTKAFLIRKATNKITARSFVKTYNAKAQSFALGAKITAGTPVYKSSLKSVTVNEAGKVTIKAGYIGKAIIRITVPETDNYTSVTKKITVTVNPTKTALTSVKNSASGKMTLKWKRRTIATGYQIQYSLSGKFTSAKSAWITKNTVVTRTIGGLTKGKKYYVRVRAYKKSGSNTCYSAWSTVKAVKISK